LEFFIIKLTDLVQLGAAVAKLLQDQHFKDISIAWPLAHLHTSRSNWFAHRFVTVIYTGNSVISLMMTILYFRFYLD